MDDLFFSASVGRRTPPTMVLLVDDQPMVGEAVRRLVVDQGDIDLHYCPDPVKALAQAAQVNPTVILQDLVMPQVDGLDLVRMFRAHPVTAKTPIIVLSTREDAYVKSQAFSAGANDYLVKLPDKLELVARIRLHARAHLSALQRDEAMQALRESQRQLLESHTALLAANQKLEEATRTKSEFLANMSHEIRTPMNGVIAITDLLLQTPLTADQRDCVERVQRSGDALLTLVNDILDLSKIEAGKMHLEEVDFDLRAVIADTLEVLRHRAASKGIALKVDIAQDVPGALRGDPVRVRQILTNLLGNGVKFTDAGEVSLKVAPAPAEGARHLRFVVRDTGIGIAPDAQGRLFQAFSQADSSTTRRFGGTGLGLAICKRLIDQMGGQIGLESTPGEGTTFWFVLPFAVAAASAAPAPARTEPSKGTCGGAHILVAEDNPTNQFATRRLLEMLGCTVQIAGNGVEAVEAFRGSEYALVLMDCQMPEMDGLQATRAIRDLERLRQRARTPILALTASTMQGDAEKCADAGMDGFIPKPVKLQALRDALTQWCSRGEPLAHAG